jgi:chromosome segregation ATPase
MRTSRMLTIAGFLAALVITCGPAMAQQSQSQSGTGDPVADAARKAREEKKNAAKPKHVLTDDDIAPKPVAHAASSTGSTAAPNSTAATGDDAGKKEDANSEGAWRKKFAAQRKKIADAQLELDVLQREIDKADVQYYSDPTKAMNEQYSRAEINAKTDKLDAKKKEIAALTQQLSDLEDDLRKAGGDPGWAR